MTGEEQYLTLCNQVAHWGQWVPNARTGKDCRVSIGHTLSYNVIHNGIPLVTTRECFWQQAIAEMLGYMRGYNNAADFRKLGCKTWDANANENEYWIASPHRQGRDDMGYCYGEVGSRFRLLNGDTHNQWLKIVHDLSKGIDDRREIVTFWHPGETHRGCLAPCMHTHTFSLIDDMLYLNSDQRSIDIPLGLTFNMVQVAWLLIIMAQITGNKPCRAKHDLVNCHIYEDQIDQMSNIQLVRAPYPEPTLKVNPDIKTWEDLMTWVTLDDFEVEGYRHHPAIKYPFSK